jgi:hypothetical protein
VEWRICTCVFPVCLSSSAQVYTEPAKTFKTDAVPPPVFTIPVMTKGRAALEEINAVSCCFIAFVDVLCFC